MASKARALVARYRIADGRKFRLAEHDPDETGGLDHDLALERLAKGVSKLSDLQRSLYANGRWALLAVFQAMDAGGKDGTISHVMSGVSPQGVSVTSFRQPGPVELAHDYLWRIHAALPERGHIGIFNRSHYEEVLVARVHPQVLDAQKLPEPLGQGAGKDRFWKHRYKDIRSFERYVARQGIVPLKFFLHISKEEQRKRLLARLDDTTKFWKFSAGDLKERALWDTYQDAYEEAIIETARPEAPWFAVPANNKWFAHLVVVETLIDAIEKLSLKPPEPEDEAVLAAARHELEAEG
jgi:PPK2 family polyphosphate:nucleotide phosphotransferase